MNKVLLFLSASLIGSIAAAKEYDHILPEAEYPLWPDYNYIPSDDVSQIEAQEWIPGNHVIEGWDWSLPDVVEPAERSLVGLQRIVGWEKEFAPLDLKFKANGVGILWVKWRDIEPTMGVYDFTPVIDRINQAEEAGLDIILRILGHSKLRGTGERAVGRGEAPLWLEELGVNLLPRKDPKDNLNFDPSHPEFHRRYLMLINELAQTGIPERVRAAYVGYASHSFGDEGIGPHRESDSAGNDAEEHVRERLDAWQRAFDGMEYKVFMGGSSEYGFKKGFGVRRGFVEMYLYCIPEHNLGQYVDEQGYLCVDEEAPILRYHCFNGDVNEEYEAAWATPDRDFRFGKTTTPFPYRYFTSTLRALQMRCTYIHTTGHLVPEMLPFLSLELGRTVDDAPDVWCFLRTSYLKSGYYGRNDYRNRPIFEEEKAEGIEVKNFERWLYQRDAEGYETEPCGKIQQAIKMWMVQPGKYYDYIARTGEKIGFDIDDRWAAAAGRLAIKVTFFDSFRGELVLAYQDGQKIRLNNLRVSGDQKLKTATFFIDGLEANGMEHDFDFVLAGLKSGGGPEKITVSFVRAIEVKD